MKSNIATIMNKELRRFIGDRRLLFALILPALMIYVIYSFVMPVVMSSLMERDKAPQVYVVDAPETLQNQIEALNIEYINAGQSEIETIKAKIVKDEEGLLVVFPSSFESSVASYDVAANLPAPNVQVYYNSISTASSMTYSEITEILDTYESSLSNKFDVNRDIDFDMATDKGTTGKFFSMIMPLFLMMFLFTGCMSLAPDAIAGEKERGTIATMLVTPVGRYEIVVGKILAFSIIAVLSGALSFLATVFSLPNMVGFAEMGMSADVYSSSDYVLLFTIIITTILLMVSVVSVISTFAKTTKEATTLISPLMIVFMLIAMVPMMGGKPVGMSMYFIPFYSSVQCLSGIFSFTYEPMNILLANISNLVYTGILVFAMTRMFNDEKVMFSR